MSALCGHPYSATETCTLPSGHGPDASGRRMHGHPGGTHWWAHRDWFVSDNTRTEKTGLPPVCVHCEAFVADATKHPRPFTT